MLAQELNIIHQMDLSGVTFMAFIPEELKKSTTDTFTHLRNIQENMEYGSVGMIILKLFNG